VLVDTSATPEPATWIAMVAGCGAIGSAMRSRKRVPVNFAN